MERRFVDSHKPSIETREDGSRKVSGYAAVYFRDDNPDTEFRIIDDLVERIMPGAFDISITNDDVRALVNHDPSQLLGRTSAGTLRLSSDDIGLRYDIDIPQTSAGKDVVASIERGDITGASFSFELRSDGVTWTRTEKEDIREIRSVVLYDVGPVTFPAYLATSAAARSESYKDIFAEREELTNMHKNNNKENSENAVIDRGRAMEMDVRIREIELAENSRNE